MIAARTKEQKRHYKEATKWRRATETGLGDVDLEEEMEKTAEQENMTSTTTTTTTVTKATSSTRVVMAEVYSELYTKSAELRGECNIARSEKRANLEREQQEQRQKEEEEHIAKEKEAEEQR